MSSNDKKQAGTAKPSTASTPPAAVPPPQTTTGPATETVDVQPVGAPAPVQQHPAPGSSAAPAEESVPEPPPPPAEMTLAGFWREIGHDLDTGVTDFHTRFGNSVSDIIACGFVESFDEDLKRTIVFRNAAGAVSPSVRFRIGAVWRTLVRAKWVLGSALILLAVVVGVGWFAVKNVAAIDARYVLRHRGGLPAYHKLAAGEIGRGWGTQESTQGDALAGRYLLKDVADGAKVSEDALLAPHLTTLMENRLILSIPVRTEAINDRVTANTLIGLIFASNSGEPAKTLVLNDVVLLGVEKRGEITTLVTALTPDALTAASNRLADSRVLVVQGN